MESQIQPVQMLEDLIGQISDSALHHLHASLSSMTYFRCTYWIGERVNICDSYLLEQLHGALTM